MITKKDEGKPTILHVRETATGKLVWRNFGFTVGELLANGNVRLWHQTQQDIYFPAKDIRVIDK